MLIMIHFQDVISKCDKTVAFFFSKKIRQMFDKHSVEISHVTFLPLWFLRETNFRDFASSKTVQIWLHGKCEGQKNPEISTLWNAQCGKTRNSLSPKKVFYLVNPLLSRNFHQKCVRENSRNFHTVKCLLNSFHTQYFVKPIYSWPELISRKIWKFWFSFTCFGVGFP